MTEQKHFLDGLGMKKDDCFEKADLINRINEYKETKKSANRAICSIFIPPH